MLLRHWIDCLVVALVSISGFYLCYSHACSEMHAALSSTLPTLPTLHHVVLQCFRIKIWLFVANDSGHTSLIKEANCLSPSL